MRRTHLALTLASYILGCNPQHIRPQTQEIPTVEVSPEKIKPIWDITKVIDEEPAEKITKDLDDLVDEFIQKTVKYNIPNIEVSKFSSFRYLKFERSDEDFELRVIKGADYLQLYGDNDGSTPTIIYYSSQESRSLLTGKVSLEIFTTRIEPYGAMEIPLNTMMKAITDNADTFLREAKFKNGNYFYDEQIDSPKFYDAFETISDFASSEK